MEANHLKTQTLMDRGLKYRITYVQNHATKIDEAGLRKALTAKVYDKYTVRKLNRPAMEKAMENGEIDKTVVAKYVTIEPSKPFLKVSASEVEQ